MISEVYGAKLLHEKPATACDEREREQHAKELATLWGTIQATIADSSGLWIVRTVRLDDYDKEDGWSSLHLIKANQLTDLLPDADCTNGIDVHAKSSNGAALLLCAYGAVEPNRTLPTRQIANCKLLSPSAAQKTKEAIETSSATSGNYYLFNQFYSGNPDDFHDLATCIRTCEQNLSDDNRLHDKELWFCG